MATMILTVIERGQSAPTPRIWTDRPPTADMTTGRLGRMMRRKHQRYSIQQLYEGYQVMN